MATKKKTQKSAGARRPAVKTASPAKRPVRREVGALACFFLFIFALLGLFGVDALFIRFLRDVMGRIIGCGFYVFPCALLFASGLLLFHRGRPVRLRLWCALLFPLGIGALVHLFGPPHEGAWSFAMLGALMDDGILLRGGGLLGGVLALSFRAVFSVVGAAVVFIVSLLFLLMSACQLSPVRLWDALFHRPRPVYEPEQPAPPAVPQTVRPVMPRQKRRRADIDVPVDDPPKKAPETTPVKIPDEDAPLLPKRPEHVRTPAEVLLVDTPAPDPAPFPIEESVPATARPAARPDHTPPAAAAPPPTVTPGDAADGDAPYQHPPFSLLASGRPSNTVDGTNELKGNAARLLETIQSFGIEARIVSVTRGPTVARYELELDRGVKLSRLTGLSDDIALSLGTSGVRIAPVPDKMSVVGIEVPNKLVSTVYIRDVLSAPEFTGRESLLTFAVGKDISGTAVVHDLSRLTHLLIAGTTGSGKSVCMNSLIVSLLYKAAPKDVRMVMIDPKMVELGIYNGIPHLEVPVVTDPKKAAGALHKVVDEMEKRYKKFMENHVRDIFSYNALAARENLEKMPQMVVIIDELADLMLVAAKEVEESICRIAQKARAAGIHLVIATQRPSADVITGLMKANIPSRIAFAVASQLESRIILDTMGAEKLVGRGDMLLFPLGAPKPTRVQGCLITGREVEAVVNFVKRAGEVHYSEEFMDSIERYAQQVGGRRGGVQALDAGDDEAYDDLLTAAIDVVMDSGQASVSYLQRRLKLGFSRAARLVDQMEERGIVGPSEGSKPRQLRITRQQWQEMQMRALDVDS
ncbi:MAG: DNA translocase FtsK [Oscillospiraceae bacterium]|jgi:S-DNA-T family DNA segregation ATPase FtsK/SpoIIIE|nr:DNA translocase FtsK [Oscillospiraceae bacterium]